MQAAANIRRSLPLFLGRPGLCTRLQALDLSPVPRDEPGWFSGIVMQLPHVAPALQRLVVHGGGVDAATLRCCARALARLPLLTDLCMVGTDATVFAQLPHLRLLALSNSPRFNPAVPLPGIHALFVEVIRTRVAWDKLPCLACISCVSCSLHTCASCLRWLSIGAPPTTPVPPLPLLDTLECPLDALDCFATNLTPLLSQVSLQCGAVLLPLPAGVVQQLRALPALRELNLWQHSSAAATEERANLNLNHAASLQRQLPGVQVTFAKSFGFIYPSFKDTPIGFPVGEM